MPKTLLIRPGYTQRNEGIREVRLKLTSPYKRQEQLRTQHHVGKERTNALNWKLIWYANLRTKSQCNLSMNIAKA